MQGERYIISKPEHGSQDWLNVRWKDEHGNSRITASVAAAVHGAHPYKSVADLATELLSPTAPEPAAQNAAMERGNRLEPTLIKWAGENHGLNLVTPDVLYCYEENGVRLLATIDAIDLDSGRTFEVKTSNKRWTGTLPDQWYWQGVHQAICRGVEQIEWAIFDSDLQLHHYVQNVSSDEKQVHIDACRTFLAQIDMGMLPDDAKWEYKHIALQHPQGDKNLTVELPSSIVDQLHSLEEVRKMRRLLDEREDAIKAEVCGLLGDAEFGTIGGTLAVTWKTSSKTMLDQKGLEENHPALYKKYQKQTTYRALRVVLKGDK